MIAPIQPSSSSARVRIRHERLQAFEARPTVAQETSSSSISNRIYREIKLCVERNPGAAVAVAAGMGVVLGWA
jgi:ElaB/YqjD/DUF883 family membrane-anchored ribosome-binding protein